MKISKLIKLLTLSAVFALAAQHAVNAYDHAMDEEESTEAVREAQRQLDENAPIVSDDEDSSNSFGSDY